MPDFLRAQVLLDRQIRKAGSRCLLRRDGAEDRECWAMIANLTTSERRALKSPTNKVYSVSALSLGDAEGPIMGKDSLITFVQPAGTVEKKPLRQVAPTAPFEAGGVVMYYDIEVQ